MRGTTVALAAVVAVLSMAFSQPLSMGGEHQSPATAPIALSSQGWFMVDGISVYQAWVVPNEQSVIHARASLPWVVGPPLRVAFVSDSMGMIPAEGALARTQALPIALAIWLAATTGWDVVMDATAVPGGRFDSPAIVAAIGRGREAYLRVICLGVNDLKHVSTRDALGGNYRALLDVWGGPVWVLLPPVGAGPGGGYVPADHPTLYSAAEGAVRGRLDVRLLYPPGGIVHQDYLHPSPEGMATWLEALRVAIYHNEQLRTKGNGNE